MIRLANEKDLDAICRVHSNSFPHSFSTQMHKYQHILGGGNLLSVFYGYYLQDAPELFYVACDEKENIIGFCMGYYMDKATQKQRFFTDNKLRLLRKIMLLLLTGNRQTWKKLLKQIKYKFTNTDSKLVCTKYNNVLNDKRGDLLSVCVLPEFRGMGYAQELIEMFLTAVRNNNRTLCFLHVETKNGRARSYYERNGFEIYRIHGDSITYVKLLNELANK